MIGSRVFVMTRVRISVVVIAVLLSVELSSVELFAQPAPQGNVTIQVKDFTGAVIPGARIEVDRSSSKPGAIFKTDSEGRAVLDLPAGAHILSITYPAFKQWTRQIEVQGGVNLALDAKLDIADIGDAIVETAPVIPPPRSPEPIFLPLQPLFNFDPRPLQSTKRH